MWIGERGSDCGRRASGIGPPSWSRVATHRAGPPSKSPSPTYHLPASPAQPMRDQFYFTVRLHFSGDQRCDRSTHSVLYTTGAHISKMSLVA